MSGSDGEGKEIEVRIIEGRLRKRPYSFCRGEPSCSPYSVNREIFLDEGDEMKPLLFSLFKGISFDQNRGTLINSFDESLGKFYNNIESEKGVIMMLHRMKSRFVSNLLVLFLCHLSISAYGEMVEQIWKKTAGERFLSEIEGFPPSEVKSELTRTDVSEEDKEWLLNAVRITTAGQDNILYTDDGRVIELPKGFKGSRGIMPSRNFKYFILDVRYYNPEVKEEYEWWHSLPLKDQANPNFPGEKLAFLKKPEFLNKFIFMDFTGREIWTKDDMPGRSYISNDGKTVVAIPDGSYFSSASFYDEQGNLLKKAKFPYGRQLTADLSGDGKLFTVAAGLEPKSENTTIIAFDNKGNELWKRELKGKPLFDRSLTMSENGKHIAVCLKGIWPSSWTYVLNEKGDLDFTADFFSYVRSFSGDGNYLALLERKYIDYIDLKEKETLWRYKGTIENNLHLWLDVSLLGDFVALVTFLGEESDNLIEFTLLNKSGKVFHHERVDQSAYYMPQITFSPQGNYIVVNTSMSTLYYRITQ